MTPKIAAFAAEYLKDFNATQAAIRAGYSPNSAKQMGSRLLTRADVKAVLAPKREEAVAERAEAVNRMVLSAERTKLEIARIAYFDPRKLFDPTGQPLSITELDDDTAAVVAGLDVLEERDAEGNVTGHVKKWKIADKNAALEKASKIAGLYEIDNRQSRPVTRVVVVPEKRAD
jgi:phage terminase small subunit